MMRFSLLQPSRFTFGSNWKQFLQTVNQDTIEEAIRSLSQFLELQSFKGMTFLDIGCGSGIFSLAAYKLSADKIVSFDIDELSVECCKALWKKVGKPENWTIMRGSVLDRRFMDSLGTFDIVYSWGVLHHTGDMWQAILNAASRVRPQGWFYIALYNKKQGVLSSKFWLKVKRIYNSVPKPVQLAMEGAYTGLYIAANIAKLRNPINAILNYRSNRGMNWFYDVKDWLGGLPYEFASVDEVVNFMAEKLPSFKLVKLKSTSTIGNNWFLFRNCSKLEKDQ